MWNQIAKVKKQGKSRLAAEVKRVGGVFGKNPSRPCCIVQASKHLSVFLTVMVVMLWKAILLEN